MGAPPFHHWIRSAARRVTVLATVFALVAAPRVVIATHGPGAHEMAAAMGVDTTGDISVPGHAHDHTGHGHADGASVGHNPADHDHPLQALLHPAAAPVKLRPGAAPSAFAAVFRHMSPDGPRRPPRIV